MQIEWPGDYGEINTRIVERMKQVLSEDTEYPYLKEGALNRLRAARAVARTTGITDHDIVRTGGSTWVWFPWLGTRSFRTARRFLSSNSGEFGVTGIQFNGCYYISFKLKNGTGDELLDSLALKASRGIDRESLVSQNEAPAFNKFDPMIPAELLRKAYIADKLRTDELEKRLGERTKLTP